MMKRLPKFKYTDIDMESYLCKTAETCKFLDEGSFGIVFEQDEKTVIKVGAVNADNYISFIKCVGKNTANIHLPKIQDFTIYDPDFCSPFSVPYYSIKMEKLLNIKELVNELMYRYGTECDVVSRMLDQYFEDRGLSGIESLLPGYIEETVPYTPDMLEVRDILLQLYEQGANPDLNDRNIMWRYDSETGHFDAVIIDPVV